MAYPNMLGAKAEVTRLDSANAGALAESQPHHRDTPPEDVYVVEAGLLARGSSLLSGLPKTLAGLSDFVGQRLAAYSCGGSSGLAPASLLAPGQTRPGEPQRLGFTVGMGRSQPPDASTIF